MKDKLAIIVPFRDRQKHLDIFIPHMHEFLRDKGIDYDIFIAEQSDDRPFNYGKLCNVVVKELPQEYTYFAFHDIDMLPMDDDECDYSYPEVPLHLATQVQSHDYKLPYPQYFGGVVLINREDFELVNGYSNEYWGYGFEDLDLLYRLGKHNLYLEKFYDTNKVYSDYDEYDILPYRIEDVSISTNDKTHTLNTIHIPEKSFITGNVNPHTRESIQGSFSLSLWFQDNGDNEYKNLFTFEGLDSGLFLNDGKVLGQVWDENEKHFDVDLEYKKHQWNFICLTIDKKRHKLTLQLNRKVKEVNLSKSFKLHPHYKQLNISDDKSDIKLSTLLLFNSSLKQEYVDGLYYQGHTFVDLMNTNFGIRPSSFFDFGNQNKNFKYSSHTHRRIVLDNGKNYNHLRIEGDVHTDEEFISTTDEIYLPVRFQGKYNSLTHSGDKNIVEKYYKHDPDIEQNADIFFNEIMTGEIDTNDIGLNSVQYTITEENYDTHTTYKILT